MSNAFETFIKNPIMDDNDRRSNANINSENPMGAMLGFGSTLSKESYLNDIPTRFAEAHKSGLIHIHDLDFYDMTTTCCQIHLGRLFKTGFGNMRPPKHVQSAFMQLCIVIQSNQNDQYGGQSIVDFDIAMGRLLAECEERNRQRYPGIDPESITQEQLEQGAEAMLHNLNTMNSRAGAQVPFSSINYGLGAACLLAQNEKRAAYWANQAVLAVLKATKRGLADGETARYPIQIYRVKSNINASQDDPFWNTTEQCLDCTAKRAYPNYLFIDNAGNLEAFEITDEKTHVATMGCRTRVFSDIFGENTSYGRGNASFCTINLPRIALKNKTISLFFQELEEVMDLVRDQLMYRYNRQRKRRPTSYPSLVGDEIGIEARLCESIGNMTPMLKHFSLSIGFIGLHEVVNAFKKNHIWTRDIEFEIISWMRKRCDFYSQEDRLNFSLLATPAEGVCERLLNLDVQEFGVIEGITDKEYYTNSFHIPVSSKTTIFDKLSKEAPYHSLCNAGHISFVELDGNAQDNPHAMHDILKMMHKVGIGYGAFNVPIDHCTNCHYDGYIEDDCPECGSSDITRLRRITGYLAYLPNFNNGKKAEVRDRVIHLFDEEEKDDSDS